jgi:hypothetical protein
MDTVYAVRNSRLQLACTSGAFVAPVVALIAFFGSGVFPPHAAWHSAANVARFYRHHSELKMVGLFVGFVAISLVGPLIAVISLQLLRIEGRHPIMAFLQLVAGAVTWAFLAIPLLIMYAAAYRAGRDPHLTQTLHDLAWILFLIPIGPFIIQNLAIAAAIFYDDAPASVYPRWVAWMNLLVAASFVPDALLGFFKHGPFAYQGVFGFWVPTVTYGAWLVIMGYTTRLAVLQERSAPSDVPAAS